MNNNSFHFVGICGIGMSAIAKVLLEQGEQVTGIDDSKAEGAKRISQHLQSAGAKITTSSGTLPLYKHTTVVYSTDIPWDHPELLIARATKANLLHRSQMLAKIMEKKCSLLVAGAHGKSTVSALLSYMLHHIGLHPSFVVGATLNELETNGLYGNGFYFVAEADESDGSFLHYSPEGTILTNIDLDHLDYWKEEKSLIEGFKKFVSLVKDPKLLFWCKDDPYLEWMDKGYSYGFHPEADLHITAWEQKGWRLFFSCSFQGKNYNHIEVPLIGKHNVLNAAAVFGMGLSLGIAEDKLRKGINAFKGIKRRMEIKGENRGVLVIDDYAHHPTEIATTLQGLRQAVKEKRVIVIFQLHRYTRTFHLWQEFLLPFQKADLVLFVELYSAGEKEIPGINSQAFHKAFAEKWGDKIPSLYLSLQEVPAFLENFLRPHDVVITMGAGDVTYLAPQILDLYIQPYSLLLISGGQSLEHGVSLSSKAHLQEGHINPSFYQVEELYIDTRGGFVHVGEELSFSQTVALMEKYEIFFPCLHGPRGEDGMVQAVLQMLKKPYIGPKFDACSLAMDKAWVKRIAMSLGLKVARFQEYFSHDWHTKPKELKKEITEIFSFPCFVKAVHQGSSFGVFSVSTIEELEQALEEVSWIDEKFLVEELIEGKEVQFGCLGDTDYQTVSLEIVRYERVHTYAEKYGSQATPSILQPELPLAQQQEGRMWAEKLYKICGCSGSARIDFFLQENGEWVLNEINPIPGCTPTSPYPKLWPFIGYSNFYMFDRWVISALYRYRREKMYEKLQMAHVSICDSSLKQGKG